MAFQPNGVFNVMDYGAYGDGTHTTETNAAFLAAIAAAKAYGAAYATPPGIVYIPSGSYSLSTQLDIRPPAVDGKNGTALVGAGQWITQLHFTDLGANAAILCGNIGSEAASSANSATRIAHLSIYGYNLGTITSGNIEAGNYGIATSTTGSGASVIIEDVRVQNFRDHGICVQGPTGPVAIRDCSIQENCGYGVVLLTGSGSYPSDVQIHGGNIQRCLGGIGAFGATGRCLFMAVDIELGAEGIWPGIYVDASCQAVSAVSCTVSSNSASSTLSPSALCYTKGSGTSFIGCGTQTDKPNDNFRFDGSTCQGGVVAGGYHSNAGSGSSGYFVHVRDSASYVSVLTPAVNTGTYASPREQVYPEDGANNIVSVIGVPVIGFSVAGENFVGNPAYNAVYTGSPATNTGTVSMRVNGTVYKFLVNS